MGKEVAVTVFVEDGKRLGGYCLNFEYKKFMAGNIGFATGEMGTALIWKKDIHPKIKSAVDKFVSFLSPYRMWFDVNGIWDGEKYWFLEVTCRFGWPIVNILHSTLKCKIHEFYEGEYKNMPVEYDRWYVGFVIAVPPFPYHLSKEEASKFTGKWVYDLPLDDRHIHLSGMRYNGDVYEICSLDGVVGVVVGEGNTVEEANEDGRKRIEKLEIPDMFYRYDIGLDGRHEGDWF